MGGNRGRRGLRPSELPRLEQIVRDSLGPVSQPEKRNVFIAFVEEDLPDVQMLRAQAKKEDTSLEFNDWSVKIPFDSADAEYIRRGIRERIRQSSVTVVYVSAITPQSKWVDWEMRESVKMGKGVVAVHKGDAPPAFLPPAIRELNITVVPWKHEELKKAIEKAAKRRPAS